jgi:FAD/FMN-containing dehydrogenase
MLLTITCILASAASAAVLSNRQTRSGSNVCQQIAGNITGEVYYPLDLGANFLNDTEHFMTSSSQTPTCVVEVASPQDVSNVMKIIGNTRTPFAVKSGGHASNPGFSSTSGVFISLVRLSEVTLSSDKSTVEIGTGNVRFNLRIPTPTTDRSSGMD